MKNTMKKLALAATLLALFGLSACDSGDIGTFESERVVESFQIVGEPLQQIRLLKTVDIEEAFIDEEVGQRGANVRVHLLDGSGGIEETFQFAEVDTTAGLYLSSNLDHLMLPLRSYQLEVDFADGEKMTSTTLTPGDFEVLDRNLETLVYQGAEQLRLRVTRSEYPGRQSILIFSTFAAEPLEENLTPFLKGILGDDPSEEDLEDAADGSSPLLFEGNYVVNDDNTLTIQIPWIAVSYYGPSTLKATAIDDNLYDFKRSVNVQQGGGTFQPGEIPGVLDRVEGGTGVFASMAQVVIETTIIPG